MSARHMGLVLDWRGALCGAVLTSEDRLPATNEDAVECRDCLRIIARRNTTPPDVPIHFIHRGVQWHQTNSAPYKCGALGDEASTNRDDVTCPGCLARMGGGTSTPRLQKPPIMNDHDDGIFTFFDVHVEGNPLELVPQASGNIEITLGETLFTLSHLDRANMLRALLHDFHYSPERGGPNDD